LLVSIRITNISILLSAGPGRAMGVGELEVLPGADRFRRSRLGTARRMAFSSFVRQPRCHGDRPPESRRGHRRPV